MNMNKANALQESSFPAMVSHPYTLSVEACKKLRQYNFLALLACIMVQMLIDASIQNFTSVLTVFFASLITVSMAVRADIVRLAPLPALIVVGFNVATMSGALVAQTLDLRPLVYNLTVPEYTFPAFVLFQAALLLALFFFTKISFFFNISKAVNLNLFTPLGLMKAPLPIQIWIMGAIGLIAIIMSTDFNQNVKFGDAGGKFIPGFNYLAFAPFLLPALPHIFANNANYLSIKKNYKFLLPYFAILVIIGISANTRGGFSGPIANLGLLLGLLFVLGQLIITKTVRRWLMACAMLILLGSTVISDLAVAMLVVRGERESSTATELVAKTFNAFQSKKELKAYVKSQKESTGMGDYEEDYISNLFLARLIVTKFTDNMLSLNDVRNGRRADVVWDVTKKTMIALLPTPVLKFFGSNLDKDNLRFSMGDVLYAAQNGIGMGTYKLGSSVAHGVALMGLVSFMVVIPIFLAVFVAAQSLTLLRNNRVVFSPVILLQLIALYYISIGDSFFDPVNFLSRTLPQTIFIYVLVFQFSRLIIFLAGSIWNPKRKISSY